VDQYRTEDEQVEALKRWWRDNGQSTVAAIIIALSAGFGWQTWKGHQQRQQEEASDAYQAMMRAAAETSATADQTQQVISLAEGIKESYGDSTYAQFAALHLARMAVERDDLAEAEAQLRWVLGEADKGSDTAWVAQLRLARVLAASGEADQALAVLGQGAEGPYQASFALARGDILLQMGRGEDARGAYNEARLLAARYPGQVNMVTLEQKLQSLSPVPPTTVSGVDSSPGSNESAPGER
jgi:predicted negative regulator of RcsB-dependent stress response